MPPLARGGFSPATLTNSSFRILGLLVVIVGLSAAKPQSDASWRRAVRKATETRDSVSLFGCRNYGGTLLPCQPCVSSYEHNATSVRGTSAQSGSETHWGRRGRVVSGLVRCVFDHQVREADVLHEILGELL